jgi:AraC-like DNA-binding protein
MIKIINKYNLGKLKSNEMEEYINGLLEQNPDIDKDEQRILKHVAKHSGDIFIYTCFKELINRNRIIVFQELVVAGKSKSYNLDGLAVQCGFSSRFHLFANFKKYHGGSPSDYIKAFEG